VSRRMDQQQHMQKVIAVPSNKPCLGEEEDDEFFPR
jgi:hypothetical protein